MRRIGIVNLFPYRPHVQNMAFINSMLEKDGFETKILHCDKNLNLCYYQLFKSNNNGPFSNCFACSIGSIKHYVSSGKVDNFSQYSGQSAVSDRAKVNAKNCLANIWRIEDYYKLDELEKTDEFKILLEAKGRVAHIFNEWYKVNHLDGVIMFNGRMDLLNTILEICQLKGYPIVTIESAGSDRGIRIIPNDSALSKVELDRLLEQYIDRPLKESQLKVALNFFNGRLKRSNSFEWRQYHQESTKEDRDWGTKGKRVLILPSSNYEFYGNYDLTNCWKNAVEGFNDILTKLNISREDVLVRFHPNWNRSIAGFTGNRSIDFYTKYCNEKKIQFIPADSKIDTQRLMDKADLILVNGGSSAIEAVLMGKKVLNVFPGVFSNAGFCINHYTSGDPLVEQMKLYDQSKAIRQCLRYLYFKLRRFPQYINNFSAVDSVTNNYFYSEDSTRLMKILAEGKLITSDASYDNDDGTEKEYVKNLLNNHRYYIDKDTTDEFESKSSGTVVIQPKKWTFSFIIYKVRKYLKRGDS